MGRVFSAFLLGYALFMVPGGVLADRWGTRRVLELASWWWVAATSLQMLVGRGPLAGSVASTLALAPRRCASCWASAQAPTFPAAARGVARWVAPDEPGPRERVRDRGDRPRLGDRAAARLGGDGALGLAGGARGLDPAGARDRPRLAHRGRAGRLGPASRPRPPPGAGGAAPLRSRSFVLLTLSYTLQGYVGYIFVFWFYLYLVQERHFDLLKGAVLSSLPWLLSIVSIPLGGWLSDRIAARHGLVVGRRAVPLVGLALAGVFLSLGARTTNGYLAAVSSRSRRRSCCASRAPSGPR